MEVKKEMKFGTKVA